MRPIARLLISRMACLIRSICSNISRTKNPEWIRKDLITALEQTQAPNYLFIGEKPLYTDEMADALIAYISREPCHDSKPMSFLLL